VVLFLLLTSKKHGRFGIENSGEARRSSRAYYQQTVDANVIHLTEGDVTSVHALGHEDLEWWFF
jgi:hypothetical protein